MISKYLLEVKFLIDNNGNSPLKCEYVLAYSINKLRSVGQNATIYDKELDMYFENRSKVATLFEIELKNVYFELDKSLAKSADFIRRTFYRYDWISPRVNLNGKIIAVDNTKELIKQWDEMKELLKQDYDGEQVIEYINSVDIQMAKKEFYMLPFLQYLYLGLIFPSIPAKHKAEWYNSRVVELSDFDQTKFEETITFESEDAQSRRYAIEGKIIEPNDRVKLNKFLGYMYLPKESIHPLEVEVDVEYEHDDTIINWNFKLIQI